MNRRKFLLRSVEAGVGATALGLFGYQRWFDPDGRPKVDEGAFAPIGREAVAVLKAPSYDADLEAVVADGLDALDVDVKGLSVVLKPNLVEYVKGASINTDPRLLAATAAVMRRRGAKRVVVGEGPGHRRDTEEVLRASGLRDVLADTKLRFVDLNTDAIVEQKLRTRFTDLGSLWLPRTLTEADLVVSMPKMKTHHWAGVTLSMKNLFGCVPSRVYGWPKNVLHFAGVAQSIVDVAAAVNPGLCIVDGIVGMQGNGPIQGDEIASGVVVFGTNVVATDVTAMRVMGLNPEGLDWLQVASGFLGQGDPDRIDQRGEDPASVAVAFDTLAAYDHLRLDGRRRKATSSDDDRTGAV